MLPVVIQGDYITHRVERSPVRAQRFLPVSYIIDPMDLTGGITSGILAP